MTERKAENGPANRTCPEASPLKVTDIRGMDRTRPTERSDGGGRK